MLMPANKMVEFAWSDSLTTATINATTLPDSIDSWGGWDSSVASSSIRQVAGLEGSLEGIELAIEASGVLLLLDITIDGV